MKKYLIEARRRLAGKAYESGDFRRSVCGAQDCSDGGQAIIHFTGVAKYSDCVDSCAQAGIKTDYAKFIKNRVFTILCGVTIKHDFFSKELKKAREQGAPRGGRAACAIDNSVFDMRILDLFVQTLRGDISVAIAENYPLIKFSAENGEAYVLGLNAAFKGKIYATFFGSSIRFNKTI